jgi:DNA polymerase-3 subunit delta'
MAPRPLAPQSLERIAEADRFEGTPHPRENVEFFGQATVERALVELWWSGQIPPACLIAGPPGIGKATLAWRLARFILSHPDPATNVRPVPATLFVPPDHPVARQIVALSHPDVFLLRRTWNSKDQQLFHDIRVDDVRKAARMFRQSSGCGGFRICILDCAEDLNAESANALLKILEEPPPRSLFLIIAHKPDSVLPTIRSRCRKMTLRRLEATDISRIIEVIGPPWSDASDHERQAASASARGSVHDALRRLGTSGTRVAPIIDDMLADLPGLDWHKVHALADRVARPDGAEDFDTLLIAALDWLHCRSRRECDAGQGGHIERAFVYAGAWKAAAALTRRMTTFNLDKRSVVLSLFGELAAAARAGRDRDRLGP